MKYTEHSPSVKEHVSIAKKIRGFWRWCQKVVPSIVQYYGRSVWEIGKLVMFERYKLRSRMTSPQTLDYPLSGDQYLF